HHTMLSTATRYANAFGRAGATGVGSALLDVLAAAALLLAGGLAHVRLRLDGVLHVVLPVRGEVRGRAAACRRGLRVALRGVVEVAVHVSPVLGVRQRGCLGRVRLLGCLGLVSVVSCRLCGGVVVALFGV